MDKSTAERPRREKKAVSNKAQAFEKLKQLKSGNVKHKYELKPIENVYDEVDEQNYAEVVLKRQEDDWIEDDGGGDGYVENGLEIFDDDLDQESIAKESKTNRKRDRTRISRNATSSKIAGGSDISRMLANMPSKKKKEQSIEDDDLLGSLISELNAQKGKEPIKKVESDACENEVENYMSSFSAPLIKKSRLDIAKTANHDIDSNLEYSAKVNIHRDNLEKNDLDIGNENEVDEVNISDCAPSECEKGKLESSNCLDDREDISCIENYDSALFVDKSADTEKDFEVAIENFEDTNDSAQPPESVIATNVDLSSLPLVTSEGGEQVFQFFYWDAYEDIWNQPGTVFLFGKVYVESSKAFVSCCVIVRNIERRVFLLPREKNRKTGQLVSLLDVYNEVKVLADAFKIKSFRSKKVEKNYAFGKADVPEKSEYLEMRYSATTGALPANLKGDTFSHVFGANSSFLELFLLERKIKGPNWLNVRFPILPKGPQLSWCKLEVICDNFNDISVATDCVKPPPPLTCVTLSIQTGSLPKKHENQILGIAMLVETDFHTSKEAPKRTFQQRFCFLTKPTDTVWPYDCNDACARNKLPIKLEQKERSLLNLFLAKFYQIDADLVVGHDIFAYDIATLVHRMVHKDNKITSWSRLGRLRRVHAPQSKGARSFAERNVMCGRLVCDTMISARELMKARSYDLDTISHEALNTPEGSRKNISSVDVRALFATSDGIIKLIRGLYGNAESIVRIMYKLNAIPLALQITNIAGNVMSRTLTGGRSERNEFLLLHAFHEKDYIVPDKVYGKRGANNADATEDNDNSVVPAVATGRKKPQYEGGLVLEPKKGFYDKLILLMDFNSLYPSIIQEFNICFTTLDIRVTPNTTMGTEELESLMAEQVKNSVESPMGILPIEIRKLVQSRRDVKNLMKKQNISDEVRNQYDIRQMALKLTANSMYGCLGFANSRFCAKPLAALVTAKGREILMNTRDMVLKTGYDVIYGDTDSLMINTMCEDIDQVQKIGSKIKLEVNRQYKQVELDVDGVFRYMLLLKKKKYAAVSISKGPDGKIISKQEIKGLDVVRRDWSQISSIMGRFVLDQILSDKPTDEKLDQIHTRLTALKEELEEGKVPIKLLAITKQLGKNPEDYPDKNSLPHVQVALRINSQSGSKKFRSGDTVPYVICLDGREGNVAATQRAYHIDELKSRDDLKIDVKYYLSQQIHPVVSRLCEPIEGTDSVQIAECLGLDSTQYHRKLHVPSSEETGEPIAFSNEIERYKDCEKFEFACPNESCRSVISIDGPVLPTLSGSEDKRVVLALEQCSNPDCTTRPYQYIQRLRNLLTLEMNKYVKKYYQNWMLCEEVMCSHRTKKLSLNVKNGAPICNSCNRNILLREYSEWSLYNQISYFRHMFDVTKVVQKYEKEKLPQLDASGELYKAYCALYKEVDDAMSFSAYNYIDFENIADKLFL